MDLKNLYKKFHSKIQKRKLEFKNNRNDKQKIFKELCFCLLTPQSKALNCWSAVEELFKNGFPNVEEKKIKEILSSKVRFHNNKTKYLLEVAKNFDLIYKIINKNLEPQALREILIREIKGLGYKEASHFLRNIGYSFDLAILDRHIIKNLLKLKVINKIPKSLTKKEYLKIEKKFVKYSKKMKIPPVDLDLLFWALQTGCVFK
jgi:N-glycosylase/DNA lyase